MIDIMVKNILNNTDKINNIAKHINKLNKKHCLGMLLMSVTLYSMTKAIKNQEERIIELEIELEGIKSHIA